MNNYYVYILTNRRNELLYIGMTGNLHERITKHKSGNAAPFTTKYKINKLVFFEFYNDKVSALKREKQLKKWNRAWKIQLIEKVNPEWKDLDLQSS